jgi:segregation and condensation protein B
MELTKQIEAILFWKAEPISIKRLASILNTEENQIKTAISTLEQELSGRGITVITNEDEVTLGTNKNLSSLIENITKEELSRDLGKAGLETLSIILYQGPISRADIDYVRGVNSQFILRALLVRGLVERIDNPKDARSFLYKPTIQLLSHLGISKVSDLPDFQIVKEEIEKAKNKDKTIEPSPQ